jgi:hypothetical protein
MIHVHQNVLLNRGQETVNLYVHPVHTMGSYVTQLHNSFLCKGLVYVGDMYQYYLIL